ncbi:glycosyltransferase [Brevundimonas sp.]|uniref:glycosyltransferase n=1 Tax=Brevundimonas sp. TaxID=1871086 RepID=UPI0025EF1760|nr:glycosyltransferase [Brevundimonas sp.]
MRALVITPFAPVPANAGHRLRVLQSLASLRRAVSRIDMLHICFEEPWRWGSPPDLADELRKLIDGYFPTPAPRNAGLPPLSGECHQLDEWWSHDLETRIRELLELTTYDVVVAHNVWLSKALTLCPPRTAKVIELHDVFYPRLDFYRRTGRRPEYFLPTREDEVFGLNRADLLISIQQDEAQLLEGMVSSEIVTIPYAPEGRLAGTPARETYRDPETLTVGFIGSAHPFNVDGLNAFLAALEREVGSSFAPVDVVIAGRVCAHVRTSLPVRLLGEVRSEDELYDAADLVVAPLFDGSGLKIKVVDAVARGMPVLCAAHAAKGIPLPEDWIFETPQELAVAVADWSWDRPVRRLLSRQARAVSKSMMAAAESGEAELRRALVDHRPSVLLNAADTAENARLLRTILYLGYARVLRDHVRVSVVIDSSLFESIQTKIASGVEVFTDVTTAEAHTRPSVVLGKPATRTPLAVGDRRFGDAPTAIHLTACLTSTGPDAIPCYAPTLTGPFFWEPATQALLALHLARSPEPPASLEVDQIVSTDGRFDSSALLDVFVRPQVLSEVELAPSRLSPAQNAVIGDLISLARLAEPQPLPGETYAATSDDVWVNRAKADRCLVKLVETLHAVQREAA